MVLNSVWLSDAFIQFYTILVTFIIYLLTNLYLINTLHVLHDETFTKTGSLIFDKFLLNFMKFELFLFFKCNNTVMFKLQEKHYYV